VAFSEDVLAAKHLRVDLEELKKFLASVAVWITHEVQ
jgi:hypothetical protein